jgi:hypothetical protein
MVAVVEGIPRFDDQQQMAWNEWKMSILQEIGLLAETTLQPTVVALETALRERMTRQLVSLFELGLEFGLYKILRSAFD